MGSRGSSSIPDGEAMIGNPDLDTPSLRLIMLHGSHSRGAERRYRYCGCFLSERNFAHGNLPEATFLHLRHDQLKAEIVSLKIIIRNKLCELKIKKTFPPLQKISLATYRDNLSGNDPNVIRTLNQAKKNKN